MCTSIAFFEQKLFGRNLDLEVSFGQRVVIAPRSLAFPFAHRPALTQHYAVVGMASVAGGLPLFAEGMNEKGLYMAGLNFPGNAHYFPDEGAGPDHLAPHELLWLVLGGCAAVLGLETDREMILLAAWGYVALTVFCIWLAAFLGRRARARL